MPFSLSAAACQSLTPSGVDLSVGESLLPVVVGRNVLVTYDFAMCRGGPGDDHAPEVFYEFKIRNDSSVAVPFMIQFVKFSDLPLNT